MLNVLSSWFKRNPPGWDDVLIILFVLCLLPSAYLYIETRVLQRELTVCEEKLEQKRNEPYKKMGWTKP